MSKGWRFCITFSWNIWLDDWGANVKRRSKERQLCERVSESEKQEQAV